MRHVGPVRAELGTRTIFNLLGPLSNPAGVERQMVGVFCRDLDRAGGGGADNCSAPSAPGRCMADGLDEITTTGADAAWPSWPNGEVRELRRSSPSDVGLAARRKREDLRGGDAGAERLGPAGHAGRQKPGAYRDTAL